MLLFIIARQDEVDEGSSPGPGKARAEYLYR